MQKHYFGTSREGEIVTAYRLENSKGAAAVILDYGCILQSLLVPRAGGGFTDVVLGYDSLSEYEESDGYLGAVIGRMANRLAKAELVIHNKQYKLAKNDGENHIHGGKKGFDRYVWKAEEQGKALVLRRLSPDGEEGYPGNLQVQLRYELTEDCALRIGYFAETDGDTVVNLSNHSYFNLRGGGDILRHQLQIYAEAITENDAESLPTGRILPVAGTPFDFRAAKEIGRDLELEDVQLRIGKGYDQNFVLSGKEGLREAACLFCPETGIQMQTLTTLPGMQLYTANHLSPRRGKGGIAYDRRHAVCLETQYFPDALRQPHFPQPILRSGEVYQSETVYQFSVIGQSAGQS